MNTSSLKGALLYALLFASFCSSAQVFKNTVIYRRGWHYDLYDIQKKQFITSGWYDRLLPLSGKAGDSLFLARSASVYGIVRYDGVFLLPVKYDYIDSDELVVTEGKKIGIFSRSGKWLLAPGSYDDIDDLDIDGPVRCYVIEKKEKEGVFANGKMILPISYDLVDEDDGFIVIKQKKNDKAYFGLADVYGKILLKPVYDEVEVIAKNTVLIEKEGKEFICNLRDPAKYLSTGYRYVINRFSNSEEGYFCVMKNEKYGFVDSLGKELIYPQFDSVTIPHEGRVFLKKNKKDKFFLADMNGTQAGTETFDSVYAFNEGFASICKNGKWGFVNKAGEIVIPPSYEMVWHHFERGMASVVKNGKRIMIGTSGQELTSDDETVNNLYVNAYYQYFVVKSAKKQPLFQNGKRPTNWYDTVVVRLPYVLCGTKTGSHFINWTVMSREGKVLLESYKSSLYPLFSYSKKADSYLESPSGRMWLKQDAIVEQKIDLSDYYAVMSNGGVVIKNGDREYIYYEYSDLTGSFFCTEFTSTPERAGIIDKNRNIIVPFIYSIDSFYLEEDKASGHFMIQTTFPGVFSDYQEHPPFYGVYGKDGTPYFENYSSRNCPMKMRFGIADIGYANVFVDSNFIVMSESGEEEVLMDPEGDILISYDFPEGEGYVIENKIYKTSPVFGYYKSVTIEPYLPDERKNPDYPLYFVGGSESIAITSRGNLFGFYFLNGDSMMAPRFQSASIFYHGASMVKENGKWGVFLNDGKYAITPQYDELYSIDNELARFHAFKGKLCGVVDRNNNIIIPFEYQNLLFSFDYPSLISAQKNGKWGVIDLQGKVIVDFIYSNAHHVADGVVMIQKGALHGYVIADGSKTELISPKYENATCFYKDIAIVKEGGKIKVINKKGETVRDLPSDVKYTACYHFGLAVIVTAKGEGVMNYDGQIIIPPVYNDVDINEDTGLIKVTDRFGEELYYTKDGMKLF